MVLRIANHYGENLCVLQKGVFFPWWALSRDVRFDLPFMNGAFNNNYFLIFNLPVMDNFSQDNETYYQQRMERMRELREVRPFSGLKQNLRAEGDPLFPDPTNMSVIQLKVADFQFKMKEINGALQDAEPFMQIQDQENFFTQFYVDRAALARLAAIAARDEFTQFGVFFGLEDPKTKEPLEDLRAPGFGRLTCCFVGLDKESKVMGVHFPGADGSPALLQAEETWPPPPPNPTGPVLNLTRSTTEVFAFFENPALVDA